MNIAKVMIPKALTVFLQADDTVRRGLEAMARHGYTTLPVTDGDGRYLGSLSEGDLLRHVMAQGTTDPAQMEKFRIRDIIRPDFCPAISIDAPEDTVVDAILRQNFVPVVDARNTLCGIITRRRMIGWLAGRA